MKRAKNAAFGWLVSLTFCMAGCSGEFILTMPDTVGQAGGDVPVAMRLQRREIWKVVLPVSDAAICFCMPDGSFKAARTDRSGYASVIFPSPDAPGHYDVCISHQSPKGETCQGSAMMYILPSDKPLAVVDFDSLPDPAKEKDAAVAASAAVYRMQDRAAILYLSNALASDPTAAHDMLSRLHYVDGAVVPAFTKRDRLKMYEAKTVPNMLVVLRDRLSGLRYGITADADMANAMRGAGLEVYFVGNSAPPGAVCVRDFGRLELPATQPAAPPAASTRRTSSQPAK